MSLLTKLKAEDKKGLFLDNSASDMYSTGFMPFDYRNGTKIIAKNNDDEVLETWDGLGFVGGTLTTIVGKSGTAKTTFTIQVATHIISNYENGMILHYDTEQATTITRIRNLSGWSNDMLTNKYALLQDNVFIQDIFTGIMKIIELKKANKDDIMINTGKLDEMGRPLIIYPPTIIIIDSIPGLASREYKDEIEMQGSTYGNRMAKELSQFFNRLYPLLRPYNISIIAINHLKDKIDINPMQKKQAQIMYFKQDEAVPGGTAPLFYSHTYLKFVTSKKLTEEKDYMDGVVIKIELIKSRTNTAGKSIELIYNQTRGFSNSLSLLYYAKQAGLIGGRNPKLYFINYPDIKFSNKTFERDFIMNEELRKIVNEELRKIFNPMLSTNKDLLTSEPDKNIDVDEVTAKILEDE